MADQILVAFQGGDAGVGELSWGQRELWGGMQQKRFWMPIGAVMPLRPGTTIDDAVDDLRFLMTHYPTLRTRLRLDPDSPKQVVSGSGEVPLEVVDAGPEDSPSEVAEQVRKRYWYADYDFVDEWPVRMAVVRHRGELTHRVWVMCHLAADGIGAAIMLSELADRDPSRSAASMAPLAQARWQGTPAGQRQSEMSLRHWERLLRTVPIRRFPDREQRTRPRYWNGRYTSPALHLAARAIDARTGTGSSPALLAAFAVALARVTGISPVVTRVVVNNRFRRGLARTVSPIVQNGLIALDVAGISIEEAMARARRQAMTVYKYAYYDPARLDEVMERVRQDRGGSVDIGCFFNDRRRREDDDSSEPAAARIRAALRDGALRWDEKQDDRPYDKLFFSVDDGPEAMTIEIYIDTHYVLPSDVEACLRGMEEVAVATALDPTAPTGVDAAPVGAVTARAAGGG